jgi:hypothetical protein
MPRPSSGLVQELIRHFGSLEQTRTKMEDLLSKKKISTRDVEKVYEALFLRTMTYFEGFIEELFFGMLTKRIIPSVANINMRVDFRSDLVSRNVVLAGRDYINWFPYKRTEEMADRFFTGGRPFSLLSAAEKDDIRRMLIIRNTIAHQSSFAKKKFGDSIIAPSLSSSVALLPRERSPAGYLRSAFRTSPVQVRFEIYQIKLVDIARKIAG